MLKTLARHLLLLAVLLGLAGQGVALASVPCAAMEQTKTTAMVDMPECEMTSDRTENSQPCNDMSPGCMAMTGCAAGAAMNETSVGGTVSKPVIFAATWPATPVLIGRDIAPDPDPPSRLG